MQNGECKFKMKDNAPKFLPLQFAIFILKCADGESFLDLM